MKYFTLVLIAMAINSISASSDPFQYSDTQHRTSKEIIKFNKNDKGHKRFFGREKFLLKKGSSIKKSAIRGR